MNSPSELILIPINGINVIAIQSLLDRLKVVTGEEPADTGIKDLQDIIAVVRVAATAALERSRSELDDQSQQEAVWAMATLGELALLRGDAGTARRLYRDAVVLPDITYFQLHPCVPSFSFTTTWVTRQTWRCP
jgi:hypothetical protein